MRFAICNLLLCALLLGGCQGVSRQQADTIIANAHGGGSALATSPDSTLLASGDWSGNIRLWHLPGGDSAGGWRAHRDSVTGLAFTADGTHLLSAGYDGRIARWTRQGEPAESWQTGSAITAFTTRMQDGLLASGHADGSVRLWHADGRLLATWPHVHAGQVRAIALDRQRVASSGTDGAVLYWPHDGKPEPLQRPPSDARTLLFTPDGKALLGAGWFRLFRWQVGDGGLQTLPTEHHGIINDLAYLADGRLASISRQTDSAVLILDADSGKTLQRLQKHDLCGAAVSPSPDGRVLSTTSDDASVRIWRLDPTSEH